MELMIFIITILGFVIAFVTYKNTYVKEPKEDIQFLIHKYDTTDRVTKKLVNELKTYCALRNNYNEQFKEGLTFQNSITFLESAHTVLFKQEHRQSIVVASMGKKQMDELIKRIDIHRENIEAIQTHFDFFLKKDFDVGNRLA
jgi:hypothetical protein